MYFRYLLFNAITAFFMAYFIYFHNAINWLLTNDPTRISLLITITYIGVVGYLLPTAMGRRVETFHKSISVVHYFGRTLMGVGLIGTVIGLMHVFSTVGTTADIKSAIPQIMIGVGTAQITTLFGLGSALLISLHQFFVFGDLEDEG